MRLSVEHRTTLRYPAPLGRLILLLRMTPASSHDQIVADWRIDVDRDARLHEGRDGLGNAVTMLYVDGPLEVVTLTASGEVVTGPADGGLHGIVEPLPPALYRRTTPATTADAALVELAHDLARQDDRLAVLTALGAGVRDRLVAAPAAQTAQAFVAAARSIGIPARYVSGYRIDAPRSELYGWAEAHVEGHGWMGFDPSTGDAPGDDHVRVAIGLDAAGAAPVTGWRSGAGGVEVAVEITRQG